MVELDVISSWVKLEERSSLAAKGGYKEKKTEQHEREIRHPANHSGIRLSIGENHHPGEWTASSK